MKKKTIIPFGTMIIIYGAVFLVVLGLAAYFITSAALKDTLEVWRVVVFGLIILVIAYFFISPLIMYSIKIRDKVISMKKDFGIFPEDRIQSKQDVNLEEINAYRLIKSEKNSDGEPYKGKVSKKTYVEFDMNDGSKKRLFVSNLGNKQLLKFIDLIKELSGVEISNQ